MVTNTLSRIAAYMPSWMLVLWDKYGWIIKKKKYSFLLLAIAIFESVRVHYTVFLFYLPWLVVFFLYGYWRIFGKISFVRLILMAVSMTPWLLLVGFTLVKSFAPLLLGGPINFSSYGEERLLVDYLSVPPEYFAEGKRNPIRATYATDPICREPLNRSFFPRRSCHGDIFRRRRYGFCLLSLTLSCFCVASMPFLCPFLHNRRTTAY